MRSFAPGRDATVKRIGQRPKDNAEEPMVARATKTAAPLAALAALGIVFGDIGTSPLYALSTTFGLAGGGADRVVVYGVTSMVIWSITLVVTVLYVSILLRFDNDGEGGLLSLLALLRRSRPSLRLGSAATVLAIIGAAMFLGDSLITPAISVLSAVEGLETVTPGLASLVVPITVAVLSALFLAQRFGTARIGTVFGPVMLLWFVAAAVFGVASLVQTPDALVALSPHWIVLLVAANPWSAFLALGGVVLAVTGAEALFADMGHFGRRSITIAWLAVVSPCLMITYLGQASAVLRDPSAAGNTFFASVPGWAAAPMVMLATAATVIASQAVISGAFSVVQQAVRLDLLPRFRVIHTSAFERGQIYLPGVNLLLSVAVIALVVMFKSSAALASAYGIAVTLTISTTITLLLLLLQLRGQLRRVRGLTAAAMLMVMAGFFIANLAKVSTGGWVPLGVGSALILMMITWWRGARRVADARRETEPAVADIAGRLHAAPRVPGTTVYLTAHPGSAPSGLTTILDRYTVLSERVILMSTRTTAKPYGRTMDVHEVTDGVTAVDVEFGYREPLRIFDALLAAAALPDARFDADHAKEATFVVSAETAVTSRESALPQWQQRLFITMQRGSVPWSAHTQLPSGQTMIIGREVKLR